MKNYLKRHFEESKATLINRKLVYGLQDNKTLAAVGAYNRMLQMCRELRINVEPLDRLFFKELNKNYSI